MRTAVKSPISVAVGPYSHGIMDSEGVLYISGQTPIDPRTNKLVDGDIKSQTKRCLENLQSILHEAGLTMDDVQKVNVFLTNMNDFKSMNEVYMQQFAEPYPARTTIGVASLPLGACIEIEMIARRSR